MKLSVLLPFFMAIVAVQPGTLQDEVPAGTYILPPFDLPKPALKMQQFLFEILLRVDRPLLLDEHIKLGKSLNTDQSKYLEYTEWMVNFENVVKVNGLLPQGKFFSVMQREHIVQSYGLFNFFYFAKDWDIMVRNIAWARMNVNPGMFVYALILVVIHRDDMQGLILPQIYEIFPQQFLNSKYILASERFDWGVFNKQIMLEKEFKTIYAQEHPTVGKILDNRFYTMDWKVWQWWKLMGLDDGWQVDAQDAEMHKDLKQVWLPVDYTRDIEIWNRDSVLSYFTEDVRWNAYWYYLNLDYSKMLSGKTFNLDKDRRGEWWIYNVQQILARYYLERVSQGLGDIEEFSWYGVVKTGYNPELIDVNGNGYSVRLNYWDVQSRQDLAALAKILSTERRIQDVIAAGRFTLKNGTVLDLSKAQSVSIIGNMLQGNIDIIDWNIFGSWWISSINYLTGEGYRDISVNPNVLLNYETMLRDPLTYSLFQKGVNMFYQFKNQLPPYTREELLFPGVEIVDVQVSKLWTYFDLVDIDITTLLNDKIVFQDGRIMWDKTVLARQLRLNHKPFTFDIQVTSDKIQKAVVRVFLGPEFDTHGQKISVVWNRENFIELDEFITELVVGTNNIHRSSEKFEKVSTDSFTYSDQYNYLVTSYDGSHEFRLNASQSHSLFPDRLVLPHGWVEGMPMTMFFVITPYTADFQQFSTYDHTYLSGIGSGVRHIDNLPFGYPLDRKIDTLVDFIVPNMHLKDVKIFHLEKLDKYYPVKYENFGQFDFNY